MKITSSEKKNIFKDLSWIIDDNFDAMQIISNIYRRGKELEEAINIDASLYLADSVEVLESFDIRGRKLRVFFEHLCDGEMLKYDTSIYILKNGIYSKEEVDCNFESKFPIAFVFEDMGELNDVELFEYFQRQKQMHLDKKKNVNPNLVFKLR